MEDDIFEPRAATSTAHEGQQIHRPSKYAVIAFRSMGYAATGDRVPTSDLHLFGTINDLEAIPGAGTRIVEVRLPAAEECRR